MASDRWWSQFLAEKTPAPALPKLNLLVRMIRASDGEVFEVARIPLDDWSDEDSFELVVKADE